MSKEIDKIDQKAAGCQLIWLKYSLPIWSMFLMIASNVFVIVPILLSSILYVEYRLRKTKENKAINDPAFQKFILFKEYTLFWYVPTLLIVACICLTFLDYVNLNFSIGLYLIFSVITLAGVFIECMNEQPE